MKNILVLDLDNTLIFCDLRSRLLAHGILPDACIDLGGQRLGIVKRPHLWTFLQTCREWFRVVVWTAGLKEYAEKIVDIVFSDWPIKPHFLSREDCTFLENLFGQDAYVKDLAKLPDYGGENALIIDNQRSSFSFNPEEGLVIPPFRGSFRDDSLLSLLPVLWSVRDLRVVRVPLPDDWEKYGLILYNCCRHFILGDSPLDLAEVLDRWFQFHTNTLSFPLSLVFLERDESASQKAVS